MEKNFNFFLNGKNIEFDVETIKSFKQFIEELRIALLNNSMIIDTIKVNGKQIDIKNLPDYDIENIEKFEVTAEDLNIVVINTLSEMVDYVNKFLNVVEELCSTIDFNNLQNYIPTFQKIISGLQWIFTGIRNCEKAIGVDYNEIIVEDVSLNKKIEEYENLLGLFKASVISGNEKKIKEHLFNNLTKILKGSTEILKNLFNIFKSMHFTSDELKEQIKYFQEQFIQKPKVYESISEKIQVGDEREGIEIFKKEIGFFEDWVVFLKKLEKTFHNITLRLFINEKSIFDHNKNFMDKLKELTEAFENEDLILISDIIEYEMKEFIDIYLEFLKELHKTIFEQKEN